MTKPEVWDLTPQPVKGPFALEWVRSQPLLELLVAGGVGTHEAVTFLVSQGAISLWHWEEPEDWTAIVATCTQSQKLDKTLQKALDKLKEKTLTTWTPITKYDLLVSAPIKPGMLIVRANLRLYRIWVAQDAGPGRSFCV